MSSIQEIEAAIDTLPPEQFLLLREHIQKRFDEHWDSQFEEDAGNGKLDAAAAAAIAEHRAGKSTPFLRMRSRAVRSFWDRFHALPEPIQRTAIKQYRLWLQDQRHPSLRFKKVSRFWSARVTDDYRAVAVSDGDDIIWFFIGTHSDYERLLRTS